MCFPPFSPFYTQPQMASHYTPYAPTTTQFPMTTNTNKRKRSLSTSIHPSASISGRTLKRTRTRPNEEVVHQYTLTKLFSAAKTSSSSPASCKAVAAAAVSTTAGMFWSLFSRSTPRRPAPVAITHEVLCCEDCDRGIEVPGGAGGDDGEVRCVGCARVVCDLGCSASNGEGRVCLECVRYR